MAQRLNEQIAQQTVRQTDDYELADDEAMYTKRPPSSARVIHKPIPLNQRPQTPAQQPIQRRSLAPGQTAIPPGSYMQGNTKLNVHQGAPPPAGKQQQRRPQANVNTATPPGVIYGQAYKDTEDQPIQGRLRRTFTAHPLLYLGIGMVIALILWVVGSFLYTYGSNEWNDWHYGTPRTFQIDAVVGHNDSASHPTHFIALNLHGKVQVIEEPGGEVSKAKIYVVTKLYGKDASLAPITLTFQDTQHNGKPEMLVHVQGSTIVYLNQNGQFVPQPQQ